MSGISGWVDFERDLSVERSTVLAMVGTLARRGPDGEGMWAGRHAIIGHRRLALLDLADGHQPVIAKGDGRVIAVAAHTGAILNYPELRRELTSRGHCFRSGGDTEVLLNAFLEWGPGCVDHFEGTFACAVWDARSEELFLLRDRIGMEPLFYYPTKTGLLFGSEPKAILAHPLAEAVVDADGLCEVLTYSGSPNQGYFRDMRRLRSGHVLRFSRNGLKISCYWRIEAAPHTDSLKTTIDKIRGMLEESIELNLRSEVPLGSMLSGGLDSSSVVALADQALRGTGTPVKTFTVNFRRHEDNFRPDATRMTPDVPYADDVVRHLGTEHSEILIDPADLMDPVVRSAVLRAKDYPTPNGDMNCTALLLARAVREHVNVVLTGEAADLLFHGVQWDHIPAEANAGTFPWVARAVLRGDERGLGCGLIDPGVLEKIKPQEYAAERYRESVAEATHPEGADAEDRHMRELSYINLVNFMESQNAHTERLAKAVGLIPRIPYSDHRLVTYSYSIPWSMQKFDGFEKSLIRAAVKDLLPRSVIERRKTPFPVTLDPSYEVLLREELARVAADTQSPVRPLLNLEAARKVAADPAGTAGGWLNRTHVEMVLQLEMWMRDYGIRLAL